MQQKKIIAYYTAIAGCTPAEFILKIEESADTIRDLDLKLHVDFADGMAKFLTTGGTFSWGDVEFLHLEEKIN